MKKQCIHCGMPLPEEAAFCPYCTCNQKSKTVVRRPTLWRKKFLLFLACFLLLSASLYGVISSLQPKTYEGDAELTYTIKNETYHLFLRFSTLSGTPEPQANRVYSIPEDDSISTHLLLYIRQTGNINAMEEFMEEVRNCTVEALPLEDAKRIALGPPVSRSSLSDSWMSVSAEGHLACGTNRILWTLHMKNGDTLVLKQTMTIEPLASLDIYPEDFPMNTIDELQILLKKFDAQSDPATIINLHLPPVIYDGGLDLTVRSYNFYGSTEGSLTTTFTDTVVIKTRNPSSSELQNISFSNPNGIGFLALEAVVLDRCTFFNCNKGVFVDDGGWAYVRYCHFENNTTALEIDTNTTSASNASFPHCTFTQNDIGLLIRNIPFQKTLFFPHTVFHQNGSHIQNPAEHPLDVSGAIFQN